MFRNFFKSKRRILDLEIVDWIFLAIGLVVFAVITLWTITKSSIWFDEAFGAYMIHFNFFDIAKYTAADVHPPLFYWLLKIWSILFGNTELALRSMSTFFGCVSILFGYLLTNRLFNKTVARVSLIFMVLSPMLVRYGQEARMYTLVTAIALSATYVLTFAINTKKRLPWIIYGILVGLGMWTHYFSAVIWIAHWVWRADVIRRTTGRGQFTKQFFSKEWILAHVVAVGIFIPWMPFFVYQMAVVQAFGFWIPPVTPSTVINFTTNAVLYQDVVNTTGWLAFGLLAVAAYLLMLSFRVYKSQCKVEQQSYRLVIALVVVPIFVLFIISMPPLRSAFVDRYLIASALGLSLFAGITIASGTKYLRAKWQVIATVFIAGLMIVGISNVYQMGNYNKNTSTSNNARQIFELIVDKSKNGQPVIASNPWFFYEVEFYATAKHPAYFVNSTVFYKFGSYDMLKNNSQNKIMDVSKFTQDNPVFWYLEDRSGLDSKPLKSNWKPIQEVSISDSVSGKIAYKAIQYQVGR